MAHMSAAADRRWIDADDETFLDRFVKSVPGLLDDYAAARTMDMLAFQEREGIRGSLFEIGVFYGRYFSILLRSAVRTQEVIAAIDTFEVVGAPIVQAMMEPIADATSVAYLAQASRAISASDLHAVLGTKARFISIDGSHEVNDVLWDLSLAEELVSADGIVAVDDFLCPVTPGVNEAVHRFFAQPRHLVPFAYAANKLFLCQALAATTYLTLFENVVIDDHRDQRSANFRACLPDLRKLVEQELWGRRFLIVP
jgi:hypothetical protein